MSKQKWTAMSREEFRHFAFLGAKEVVERIFREFPALKLATHMDVATRMARTAATKPKAATTQRKRVHWTQTAAGKKKMAAIQRKAWRTRRAVAREHERRNG